MKRILLGLMLAAAMAGAALAQGTPNSATVVAACGTTPSTYTAGQNKPLLQDTTGRACETSTISGTVTTSNASVGATGAAVPASGTYMGINASGNLQGAVAGSGTAATAMRVELPTDGTGKVGLNAGSAIIGNVRIDQTTPGTTNGVVINSGTVTAADPVGITPTDRTITSATGASQQVMAANGSRHALIIQNTGNANCGINPTGGTAIIGGAATLTLLPGGSYQPRIPTLSAVTAICTAGQPLYAEEN